MSIGDLSVEKKKIIDHLDDFTGGVKNDLQVTDIFLGLILNGPIVRKVILV